MSLYNYNSDDSDLPQEIDLGFGDGDDIIDCPSCGKSLYEDADLCPYCGYWILQDSPAAQRSRGWFWPVMVAILIAVILVMWLGLR
ncbi:MAG: TFIIB-type zinc ribbon-containing protein [Planctomycetota bacterium]|jgi:predicted nucleic acid-binding Zn ribbon protein